MLTIFTCVYFQYNILGVYMLPVTSLVEPSDELLVRDKNKTTHTSLEERNSKQPNNRCSANGVLSTYEGL